MKKRSVWSAVVLGVVGTGVGAYALAGSVQTVRQDCPGTIACPLTGETVCRDRCPLIDPNRPDCPGKIACPLTGEPVCRDQCPAGSETTSTASVGGCCTGRR